MESRFRKSRQTIKRCGLHTFSRITTETNILTMSLATILLSVRRSSAKFYNTLKQIWHNFSCFRTQSMNFSRKFVNAAILASEKWNKISRTRILQSHSCMHKKVTRACTFLLEARLSNLCFSSWRGDTCFWLRLTPMFIQCPCCYWWRQKLSYTRKVKHPQSMHHPFWRGISISISKTKFANTNNCLCEFCRCLYFCYNRRKTVWT